jgi:hypothetical protein
VKFALAIVCAGIAMGESACTLGPAASDAGSSTTGSTSTTSTLGDQCDAVDSAYCQQGPRCSIAVDLSSCIANLRPLCCSGTACDASSSISASTVSTCEDEMQSLDCGTIASSQMPPSSCLLSSS